MCNPKQSTSATVATFTHLTVLYGFISKRKGSQKYCTINLIFVGPWHQHLIDKDDQRVAACSICLYYARGITLHVSGALCTHHQECIETVHADSGTIVF